MMITLSNGWFRNSISPYAVSEIAKSAQKSVREELEGYEQIVYSPEMRITERFFDLVFCGGVKYEYMNRLFDLTKKRALMETMLHQAADQPKDLGNEEHLDELQNGVNKSRHAINRLTPGKILEFGVGTNPHPTIREFYLVYRDAGSFSSVGIPVLLQPLSALVSSPVDPVTPTPIFDSIGEMRSSDLTDIRKSGQFFCGAQRYTVRFTLLNEPVVMYSGSESQTVDIQNRLRNLWLIGNLKKEFSEVDNATGPKRTALKLTPLILPKLFVDLGNLDSISARFPGDTEWAKCGRLTHEKFRTLVNFLHASLEAEISGIAQQLEFFETLTDPTREEIDALRSLKVRIVLFRQTQNNVIAKINVIQEKLEAIYWEIERGNDMELAAVIRARLMNFTDQMLPFVQFGMDESKFNAFITLCEIQTVFFSSFKAVEWFRARFDPVKEWVHHEIHPPFLPQEKVDSLFSLAINPANSWTVVETAIAELNRFKIKCFDLKNRQIALAHEYEQLLIGGLLNEHSVEFCELNISQKFNTDVARLRDIIEACLIPGNQFSEQELDDIQREAKSIWYALWNEHENWMYRSRISREEGAQADRNDHGNCT